MGWPKGAFSEKVAIMSRIGVKPVSIPAGVKVSVADGKVVVAGKLGTLEQTIPAKISVKVEGAEALVAREDDSRQAKALHGLVRSLVQNMVTGVATAYVRRLEVHGVGYLAAVQGDILQLRVGFANEVHKKIPKGLTVTSPQPGPDQKRYVVISGIDKQMVGQFAAEVRAVRKPEPYKGKGIRYEGEAVRRKAGKAMTK